VGSLDKFKMLRYRNGNTQNYPGCYFFAFFGIPGGKEGDITGHNRVTSEDETKGAVKA
jgi:hypothetical protein